LSIYPPVTSIPRPNEQREPARLGLPPKVMMPAS
jgi:hypothetical protein